LILSILFWYLAVLLCGWLAFPLVYRLLPYLPDRGLSFSKLIGLLLWGYIWWLLTSFHILQNDSGGVVIGLAAVAALSLLVLWRADRPALIQWLRDNRTTVILVEGVFLLAFLGWAWVRGTYPDAAGTEKPMELAFINAILNSPTFPPHDPWLSGYAISYYYFGYAMVAMLARFTGTPGAVAFNLALASWFALSASAAGGLLYDLLSVRSEAKGQSGGQGAQSASLLAPLFLLLVSNLEGFLEMLHALGLFWDRTSAGLTSSFWSWLGIQELVNPPTEPFSWIPERLGGIWWWRASRVLEDFDLAHNSREIIDEFPFFSYMLGDLHPHVLSMPFVLLAVGLALHLYLRERSRPVSVQPEAAPAGSGSWIDALDFGELVRLAREPETWLAVLVLGGLSFLNTWDFPIYLGLYGAAYLLAAYQRDGWQWKLAGNFVALLVPMGIAGILAYLPFYLGFQSQAGGLLPSLVFFTRGVHLWVMFAPLLLPIFLWVARKAYHQKPDWLSGLWFAVAVVFGLWALSIGLGLVVQSNDSLAGIYGGNQSLVIESIGRRLAQPGAWLTLLALLVLVWGLLAARNDQESEKRPSENGPVGADAFVLLLALLGTGLVLFPEFFYLRDQFGWRMNTIFKFYYQAWIVWSVAAAYGSVMVWRAVRGAAGLVMRAAWVVVVAAAMAYTVFGIRDRLQGFDLQTWTLDGSNYLARFSPKDLEAIHWLAQAPDGVVAEAVGGSYTGYARVSTFSGQPSVLGWPGHESQWRGGAKEIGSREPDIEQLYRTRSWQQAEEILARYNIRYVYVGAMEESKYGKSLVFDRNLAVAYQNDQVTIYEVPR